MASEAAHEVAQHSTSLLANPTTWVWVAVISLILLVVWKGGKPILASLDAKIAKIKDELAAAEKLREDAQATLAEYERKQRDAIKEAEAILAQARSEAETLRDEAEKRIAEVLARREQNTLDKIAQAEARVTQEVKNMAVDLAIEASTAMIKKNMVGAAADKLIDASIKETGSKLN